MGYTPHSGLDPLNGRQLAHQGWSVVVWPIGLSAPPAGTEALIPAGLVDLKVKTSMWDPKEQQFADSQYGGSVELIARPPAPIRRLDGPEATIIISINATSFRLIVSGGQMHPNGYVMAKTEIQTFTNPTGTLKVAVPDAERFAGPNGELLFHLKVEKLGKRTASALEKAVACRFESIQVALKGTVR